jgi:hypothetical protein
VNKWVKWELAHTSERERTRALAQVHE